MSVKFVVVVFFSAMIACVSLCAQNKNDSIQNKQNDTTKTRLIMKQGISGNAYTVPVGKSWKIKRLLVNNGSYNVVVGSVKYDKVLNSGEKIQAPFWCAEGNLLDNDNSSLTYTFEIEEKELKP